MFDRMPRRLRNVLRLWARDRCSRCLLWFSPELSSARLSGDRGVVDVSPDDVLNSTEETKRSRGGCVLTDACSETEWDRWGMLPPMPEPSRPTGVAGGCRSTEPASASVQEVSVRSALCESAIRPPSRLLVVVVVELDRDSPFGAWSVCWDRVSLEVQIPVLLRASCCNQRHINGNKLHTG